MHRPLEPGSRGTFLNYMGGAVLYWVRPMRGVGASEYVGVYPSIVCQSYM